MLRGGTYNRGDLTDFKCVNLTGTYTFSCNIRKPAEPLRNRGYRVAYPVWQ